MAGVVLMYGWSKSDANRGGAYKKLVVLSILLYQISGSRHLVLVIRERVLAYGAVDLHEIRGKEEKIVICNKNEVKSHHILFITFYAQDM